MARYAILSETTRFDGNKIYNVILEADDGYQETQTYVGESEDVLVNALEHFNAEWTALKTKSQEVVEPVFVEIESTPSADNAGV